LKDYIRESHRLVALGLTQLKRRELGLERRARREVMRFPGE
jgi:hypothetical protein